MEDQNTDAMSAAASSAAAKATSKVSDWFEMLFAAMVALGGRDFFKEASGWTMEKLEVQMHRIELFRHYKLVELCRPFLWTALVINTIAAVGIGFYLLEAISPAGLRAIFGEDYIAGTGLPIDAFLTWAGFEAVLLVSIAVRLWRTRGIKALSVERFLSFSEEAYRGLDRDLSEEEKVEAVKEAIEDEFGAEGRFGSWTFFLTFGSYVLTGIFSLAIGSWAYAYGVPWVLSSVVLMLVIPVAITLMGAWVFTVQFVPVAAAAIVTLELLSGLSKVLWDSIVTTALLNVEGEEAKEAIDFKRYGIGQKAAFFVRLLGSTPAAVVFALYGLCGLCWPHPYFALPTAGILFGLGALSLFSGIMGNDEDPSRKKMGLLVKFLGGCGVIYRIIETVISPNQPLWDLLLHENDGRIDHPFTRWFIDLWDGLMSTNWLTSSVLILLLVGIIALLAEYFPSEGRLQRLKYGLIGVCGVMIALLTAQGIHYVATHGFSLREVRAEASRAARDLGVGDGGSRRQTRTAGATATPPAPPPPPRRPSLGVTRDVPPIPDQSFATHAIPSCEALNARTPEYIRLSRDMGRCR